MSELVVRVPAIVIQLENLRSFRMPCPSSCAQLPSSACRKSRFAHHLASYTTIGSTRVGERLARRDLAYVPILARPCSSADPEYCHTEHLRTIILLTKQISDTAPRAAHRNKASVSVIKNKFAKQVG